MFKKILWALSGVLYIYVALAGFGYFGSGSGAQKLRATSFYKVLVLGPLSHWNSTQGDMGDESGRIIRIVSSGEIRYKPSNSFSFYPADPDHIFYGKNILSTGSGTQIVVLIGNGTYELSIGENTTIVIDRPPTSSDLKASLDVEILGGQVSARSLVSEAVNSGDVPELKLINIETGELSGAHDSFVDNLDTQGDVKETSIQAKPQVPDSSALQKIPFEESFEGFTRTVEVSMNQIFEAELQSGRCNDLKNLYEEVTRSYPENPRMIEWKRLWQDKISSCVLR